VDVKTSGTTVAIGRARRQTAMRDVERAPTRATPPSSPARRATARKSDGGDGARSSNDALEREKRREWDDARDDASDDDDDARDAYVMPPSICRPLVYTSWFPLAPACAAMARAPRDARARGLAALSCALIVSSFGHWRAPKWDSPRRYFDLFVVWASVGYGCWLATTMEWTYARGWWCGMPFVGAAFAANETAFHRELRAWRINKPPRAHRWFIYRRTTWTHLVGVHAGSSTAATWLALGVAGSRG
jgi:hypothetical protein